MAHHPHPPLLLNSSQRPSSHPPFVRYASTIRFLLPTCHVARIRCVLFPLIIRTVPSSRERPPPVIRRKQINYIILPLDIRIAQIKCTFLSLDTPITLVTGMVRVEDTSPTSIVCMVQIRCTFPPPIIRMAYMIPTRLLRLCLKSHDYFPQFPYQPFVNGGAPTRHGGAHGYLWEWPNQKWSDSLQAAIHV